MSKTEDKVIKCIDMVLEKLGTDVRRTLFLYLRREKDVKRYQIFQYPDRFITALHSILGEASGSIENEIIQLIITEFNLATDKDQNLSELLTELNDINGQEKKKEVTDNKDDEKELTYMQYSKNPEAENIDN